MESNGGEIVLHFLELRMGLPMNETAIQVEVGAEFAGDGVTVDGSI